MRDNGERGPGAQQSVVSHLFLPGLDGDNLLLFRSI